MIHKILKAYIDGWDSGKYSEIVKEASKQSSDREQSAEYCERDVDDMMKAAYMSQFLGEEFNATVSSVTGFGMFVELENTVEGLIRMADMKDDYYEFDEPSRTIRGKRGLKEYKIGDKIDVVLVRTNLLERQIDFVRTEDFDGRIKKEQKQLKPKAKRKNKRQFKRKRKR
jgi:ribonuclease R